MNHICPNICYGLSIQNPTKSSMNFLNLRPLCCMPRPKIMRTSWTLWGQPQYILVKGLLQKNDDDSKMKKEEPNGDDYIIGPYLSQRVENL